MRASSLHSSATSTHTQLPSHRRRRKGANTAHKLLACTVMAAWVLMPLMPVLALAFTWLNGLS